MDLAGNQYWEDVWSAAPKPTFNPASIANRPLVELLDRFLAHVPAGSLVLEAGCADSVVTPYIHGLGYRTAGIDYSAKGCAKFRQSSPMSAVIQADIFDPPSEMLEKADAVFSLGLVEHFTDTTAAIQALSRFVKPGGVLLTVVPNMYGTVGWLQRTLNKRAFDLHVRLTPAQLVAAHDCDVTSSGYLGSMGFGVVNHGYRPVPRALIGALARASLLACWIPCSRAFSPHLYCVARV